MNNTTIYEQLQHHYQKLQTRLAKARSKGRSQSFQERLWGRIQRCSLQMKQLGAGVAVIAALGVSTPVLGQNNTIPLSYVEKTGADNPFDTISSTPYQVYFSDLDGDGDKDMLESDFNHSSYEYRFKYYENVGTPTVPKFAYQASDTVFNLLGTGAEGISFVDVDGDGDQDMFTTNNFYYSGDTTSQLNYYENVGTTAAPEFMLQSSSNNPLQEVVDSLVDPSLPGSVRYYTNFVDIDDDGDQDCFIGIGYNQYAIYYGGLPSKENRLVYFKNEGSATNPDFQRQTTANNPLSVITSNFTTTEMFYHSLHFFDGDLVRDGDFDVLVYSSTGNTYYRNIGSKSVPNFVLSITTPMDTIKSTFNLDLNRLNRVVDLTDDGRSELIYTRKSVTIPEIRYFVDTVSYLDQLVLQGAKLLNVYPNPTNGFIQLEETLTGQLSVYNTLGQEVYSKELQQVQQVDLTTLGAGMYVLYIKTEEEDYVQQLIVTNP